jgi:hypothetical protein
LDYGGEFGQLLECSIASLKETGSLGLAVWGHLSIVIATAAGQGMTLYRGAPVSGLIIAWVLSACASDVKQRLEPDTTHDPQQQLFEYPPH